MNVAISATNVVKRVIHYVGDVREEVQKVTWPTRQQALRYSVMVLAVSASVAVFFIVLDQLFSLGLEALLSL